MCCNPLETSDYLAGLAIIISILTFVVSYFQNRKSLKVQTQTAKLEELLELILELSRYYSVFKSLYLKVEILKSGNDEELDNIKKYYEVRDIELSYDNQVKIDKLLSRIEVLYISYTNKELKNEIDYYYKMMESFYMYILNTGDSRKEIRFKDGFPNYKENNILLDKLINLLKNEIQKYN